MILKRNGQPYVSNKNKPLYNKRAKALRAARGLRALRVEGNRLGGAREFLLWQERLAEGVDRCADAVRDLERLEKDPRDV